MDIIQERRNQLLEQVDFLTYEIEYALHRVQSARGEEPPEEPFRLIELDRVGFLREQAQRIRRQIVSTWKNGIQLDHDTQSRLTARLSVLAPVLESMTHSLVQRRWKLSRSRGPTDANIHVPLNECHPNYAVFFRAVENVVHEATRRLAGGFFARATGLRFRPCSLAPLLVVSRGRQFMLDTTGVLVQDYDSESGVRNDYRVLHRRLHLMSYLTVPRHTPAVFRTIPLVGHEMFHYVGETLNSARNTVTDQPSVRRVDLTDEKKRSVMKNYGPVYSPLLEHMSDITDWYRAMLARAVIADTRTDGLGARVRMWLSRQAGTQNPAIRRERLERAATFHFVETLCDIGAVVLAGPAYTRAFLSNVVMSGDLWCSEKRWTDGGQHPPSLFRARLQLLALQYLGYTRTAAELTDSLEQLLASLTPQARRLLEPYESLVEDIWSKGGVEKLVRLLRSFVEESPLESRSLQCGELPSGDWGQNFSEGKWESGLEEIVRAVDSGDMLLDGNHSCFDILNAMWLAYARNNRIPVLPWEICLAKQRPWKGLRLPHP